jgi:hypothetical protein
MSPGIKVVLFIIIIVVFVVVIVREFKKNEQEQPNVVTAVKNAEPETPPPPPPPPPPSEPAPPPTRTEPPFIFRKSIYEANYPQHAAMAKAMGKTYYQHWGEVGIPLGITVPGSWSPAVFDKDYYLANNADLAAAGLYRPEFAAWQHYVLHGVFEGRKATPNYTPTKWTLSDIVKD